MIRRLRARDRVRLAVLTLPLLAVATSSTLAAPPPAVQAGATLRLVVAGVVDGRPEVGLEIALEPGWKTYWRSPGDAGIPPTVDWSKSSGIKGVDLRFPAPVRFGDEEVRSIGYTAPVLMPIDVTLADPESPARLELDVQVGLCHDICVPVSAHLAATLAPQAPIDDGARVRLAEARRALPVPAVKGVAPWVVRIERDDEQAAGALLVEVKMPADETDDDRCDVLVEGPNDAWALPLPEKVAESGGREIWRFDLDGVPRGADLAGAELRFTMRARDRVVEQRVVLDAAIGRP